MTTKIKAKKDLFNMGQCFTKGKIYEVAEVTQAHQLMNRQTTNDIGEPHIIGGWYRHFEIVE